MEVDEFSLKLGSLEANQETFSKQQTVMDGKLDKIIDKLTLMNGSIGKAHNRIDDMTPDLESAVANGNDWKDTKTKAKWLIGLGFLGSAGGGLGISKFFSGLFG